MAKQVPARSNEPVKTMFGLNKVEGAWVCERLEMQGDRVLSREVAEPDLKALAFEKFFKWVQKHTRQ